MPVRVARRMLRRRRILFDEPSRANYPVVGVDARQAHVYCTWLGTAAAHPGGVGAGRPGHRGRLWPWGDTPAVPGQVQTFLPDYPDVHYVICARRFDAHGATPDGIYHLVGNVAEWVVRVPADCTGADCQQPWDGVADAIGLWGARIISIWTLCRI